MGNYLSVLHRRSMKGNHRSHPDPTNPITINNNPSSHNRSPSNRHYHVFISHAGEDKATIAIPLRRELEKQGIVAFVDEEDMVHGTDAPRAMTHAMETANVAVVILSPEFIARRWPMRELMCFLRRREECIAGGRAAPVVIPFFYRLNLQELHSEPNFDHKDKDGISMYRTSRFFERQENGEAEANVELIKTALESVRSIQGLRNDVDATNGSSYLMFSRREVLLQKLCKSVKQALPAEALNSVFAERNVEGGQGQSPRDQFRKFFPPQSTSLPAVLDFDKKGVNGNPSTPEGLAKQLLLEQTRTCSNVVSIHGMGGVGKSTILRALSVDNDIRQRFPDGIHVIRLGQDASSNTLFRQLCQVLRYAGAEKTYKCLLRSPNDMDAVLSFVESWFDGKKSVFLIDDVWLHGVDRNFISRLCNIGSTSRNGALITTREVEIAALAPSRKIVRLEAREPRGRLARQILFFHADVQDTGRSATVVADEINTILDICAGLPVNHAAAGKIVKKMNMSMLNRENKVWKLYASQLAARQDAVLREEVQMYGKLFATFVTSLSYLDESSREETLGFACPLSFSKMHRRLCVLRKQAAVPLTMLKHLWEVESDEYVDAIATAFVDSGLASREIMRVGEKDVWNLSLHDSLHDFAVAEAKRNDDAEEAHESLLRGYSLCLGGRREELATTLNWWSSNLETDGYVHENLCRHLVGAGRTAELAELLLSPQWAERRLEVNDILSLEADFAVGVEAVSDGVRDKSDEERGELERVLGLIAKALNLSSTMVSGEIVQLWFQLHGRLKRYAERYKTIGKYVEWIETEAEGPLVLCMNEFLGDVADSQMGVVSAGAGVLCMVVIKDGGRVACGCGDGRIVVVNMNRGQVEEHWKAHEEGVTAIAVGRDGTRLVSGSRETTAKVWEIGTHRCVATFYGHTGVVTGVAVMRDGERVISVSQDGTARIWNTETGEIDPTRIRGIRQLLSNQFRFHGGAIRCVALLGDAEGVVVIGGLDGKLRIWNTTSAEVGGAFGRHESSARGVAVTRDGRRIVSASWHETKVWDVTSGQQISSFKNMRSVECVAVSPDGNRVACGTFFGAIHVWDLESETQVCDQLEGHTRSVSGVAFLSADRVVSSSEDGTVRIWDVTRKGTKQLPNWHGDAVQCVSFTPCGRFVVSGSKDCTLRIWDTITAQQLGNPLKGHSGAVSDAAVTPNGRYIVSVSWDETLCVWDLESHELLHTFTGHTGWITSVAITPQGSHAVTGSHDGTVRVWNLDAMDGSHIVLGEHGGTVERVFVTDDGSHVVSVRHSYDIFVEQSDEVFVWDLESKKVIKRVTKEDAYTLSRREIFDVVDETTVYDDTTLSIRLHSPTISYGDSPHARVLATVEHFVESWALSPDKKTICVALYEGQVGFMSLKR